MVLPAVKIEIAMTVHLSFTKVNTSPSCDLTSAWQVMYLVAY